MCKTFAIICAWRHIMERKASAQIEAWNNGTNRRPLVLMGARQVGKTWLIRECLKTTESQFLEINLIAEPELIPVLEKVRTVDDLIVNLSASRNFHFEKGKTILFIDEVQEVKDLVTRIKFFVDEGSFRYILSGSLLDIEQTSLRSAPI